VFNEEQRRFDFAQDFFRKYLAVAVGYISDNGRTIGLGPPRGDRRPVRRVEVEMVTRNNFFFLFFSSWVVPVLRPDKVFVVLEENSLRGDRESTSCQEFL